MSDQWSDNLVRTMKMNGAYKREAARQEATGKLTTKPGVKLDKPKSSRKRNGKQVA